MSSCSITVSDQTFTLNETAKCDAGGDDNLVSLRLTEAAVVKVIGRIQAIEPVSVQVALGADIKPQTFKFSRMWKVPRLTFHLAAGPMALFNFFLVSDDDLACEDLLLGQSVLRYLGINSRALLEQQCNQQHDVSLGDFDYSESRKMLGTIGRIMLARQQRAKISKAHLTNSGRDDSEKEIRVNQDGNQVLDPSHSRAYLHELRNAVDPFRILHLLIPKKWIKKASNDCC